jgi:hypothetical protein
MWIMNRATKELNKFRREEDYKLYPDFYTFLEEVEHDRFASELYSKTDFTETKRENDEKFNKKIPWKAAIKKFGIKGWAIVGFMTASFASVAPLACGENSVIRPMLHNQQEQDTALYVFVTLGCLLGMGAGFALARHSVRSTREDDVKYFYNRLSMRSFDYLQSSHPEIDENILKKYNPELVRFITELLIANMDESDTKQLRSFAMDLAAKMRAGEMTVSSYNLKFVKAMEIIKNALDDNRGLKNAMVLAFKGWAPSKLNLKKNNQTMMVYLGR